MQSPYGSIMKKGDGLKYDASLSKKSVIFVGSNEIQVEEFYNKGLKGMINGTSIENSAKNSIVEKSADKI